jgi:dihydropteroate synthase
MGVINLSPESFYSGSVATSEEELRREVTRLEEEGADIIDIGGASTAPAEIYYTSKISLEKELERINWALDILSNETKLPISIDTTSSVVAKAALSRGASLVNDISGLQDDAEMVRVVSENGIPMVLMARCDGGCRSYLDSLDVIQETLQKAQDGGIRRDKIILDPGIGFGKPTDVDFALLRELRKFTLLDQPLLVGVSRKAFIGALLKQSDPADRLIGTIAATSLAVANGANIVRAHDVKETKMAIAVGERLQQTDRYAKDNVALLNIYDERDAEIVINQIGTGVKIRRPLSRKAATLNFLLRNVSTPGALIIKQEMLAVGGDAAYHHDVIDFGIKQTDVLIMGTSLQIGQLIKKLRQMKIFGLGGISKAMMKIMETREKDLE